MISLNLFVELHARSQKVFAKYTNCSQRASELSIIPDISNVALKVIANIATNKSAKASETRK